MTVQINIHMFSAEVPTAEVDAGRAGSYVDHCEGMDACVRPISIRDDGHGGVVAEYHHRRCGSRWYTSWQKDQEPGIGIHREAEPTRLGDVLREVVADVARRRPQV
jgi:hypothetical protein